jgi:hypothetical protein
MTGAEQIEKHCGHLPPSTRGGHSLPIGSVRYSAGRLSRHGVACS